MDRDAAGWPVFRLVATRCQLLGVALSLPLWMGCKGESPYPYHVRSFTNACREKSISRMGGFSNDSAIALAGRYVALVRERKALPDSTAECALFREIDPVCLTPSDFDSVFAVTDAREFFYRTPGNVDLAFPDGTKIRFCYNLVVYKMAGDTSDEAGCLVDFHYLQEWKAKRKANCGK